LLLVKDRALRFSKGTPVHRLLASSASGVFFCLFTVEFTLQPLLQLLCPFDELLLLCTVQLRITMHQGIRLQGHFMLLYGFYNLFQFVFLFVCRVGCKLIKVQVLLSFFYMMIQPPAQGLQLEIPGVLCIIGMSIVAAGLQYLLHICRYVEMLLYSGMCRMGMNIKCRLKKLHGYNCGQCT
jgi:hypothetical protein